MATTQNVNINVNANTQDAQQEISSLENNIKTLDGAINLVGGSIEVLAGSLALTGAVTEEQAERFQTAAVGAIALADGSKRALEGFKILATETKLAATAQRIFNAAVNANPIALIVTALATLGIAYAAFRRSQKDTQEVVETTNEKYEKQLELLQEINQGITSGRQRLLNIQATANAYNRTLEEQFEISEKQARKDIEIAEERLRISQNASKINEDDIAARKLQLEQAREVLVQIKEAEVVAEENAQKERERRFEAEKDRLTEIEGLKTKSLEEVKIVGEVEGAKLQVIDASQKKQTEIARAEAIKRGQIAKAEREFEELLFTEGIDNIQGALAALFGENKAVASANVLIDAAQAGVAIIKNSQTTGPFALAYQATQFALLGATTIAALRQINSAEPGATGAPNLPGRGTGGTPQTSFSVGTSTIGGATGTVAPTTPQPSGLRAYVVSSDIRTAAEEEGAIRRRRTL